jgi:NADH-quinone oxidoreductase subunit N
VFDAGTTSAVVLGVIAAVNSVIAFFYYAGVARRMWFHEPEVAADTTRLRTPLALSAALAITSATVIVIGIYPEFFARLGDLAFRNG